MAELKGIFEAIAKKYVEAQRPTYEEKLAGVAHQASQSPLFADTNKEDWQSIIDAVSHKVEERIVKVAMTLLDPALAYDQTLLSPSALVQLKGNADDQSTIIQHLSARILPAARATYLFETVKAIRGLTGDQCSKDEVEMTSLISDLAIEAIPVEMPYNADGSQNRGIVKDLNAVGGWISESWTEIKDAVADQLYEWADELHSD